MQGQAIKVVAIERNITRHFQSLSECKREFGFRSEEELITTIVNNGIWRDGYTTFDFDIDVSDEQIERLTAKFKHKREEII
jgi:hypothetical protein